MAKFELYERRKYRRVALNDDDGVYCVIGSPVPKNKTVTVSTVEFSLMGFQFAVSSKMKIDFLKSEKLLLKAIAGSRNLTFAQPVLFEIVWQNFDYKKGINYVGCKICNISTESEKQFAAFVQTELNFNGIRGHEQHDEWSKSLDFESMVTSSLDSLRDSKNHYKALFTNSHAVMLLIDPESGDIIDANPAATEFYGWNHKDLTNKKITDINTLTEKQIFQEMEDAKKENRRHFFFEHRLANGNCRAVEVYSGPIFLNGKQVLYSIVHDISDRKKVEQDREKLIIGLKKALKEIKTLRGILPLCSFCKKVRDDRGNWENVDVYIHKHSHADISHTLCPECAKKHYPGLIK